MEVRKQRILVIGLGNPFWGDEGAGIVVVQKLREEKLPDWVDVKDGGTPGLGLMSLLDGYSRVIVVDAADMGLEPGEWKSFELDEVHLASDEGSRFAHQFGLAEFVELAGILGVKVPPVKIYGIQPQRLGFTEELSPAVAKAVEEVKEALLKEFSQR